MARTRYATDRGLIARMGATMFLLGLVFVAFIAALVYLLGAFSNVSSGGIVFIAALFGIGTAFGSYFWSDKIALRTSGAREVSPQQAPELHGVIDRLCALADMPKPRVAIAPTDMPNAFATGRNTKVAVLCVTEGLLRRLDRDELEGVIAHEMSHVAHKDVAVMTLASFLGIVAALVLGHHVGAASRSLAVLLRRLEDDGPPGEWGGSRRGSGEGVGDEIRQRGGLG